MCELHRFPGSILPLILQRIQSSSPSHPLFLQLVTKLVQQADAHKLLSAAFIQNIITAVNAITVSWLFSALSTRQRC